MVPVPNSPPNSDGWVVGVVPTPGGSVTGVVTGGSTKISSLVGGRSSSGARRGPAPRSPARGVALTKSAGGAFFSAAPM